MANEDTQKTIEQGNEVLIQEALRDAQKAQEPGDLLKDPIIHKGDATLEAPMTLREITSAGYVKIWDTRTYEQYPVLYYMLPAKLRIRRADGSFRFTTADPGKLPKRGTIKCPLHPEGEKRKHYDELGFRVCKKSNLTNPYQMKQHLRKKHPQEWEAIENERKETERLEDRALQRAILATQLPKTEPKVEPKQVEEKTKAEFVCDVCRADFGTRKILDNHKQEQHK